MHYLLKIYGIRLFYQGEDTMEDIRFHKQLAYKLENIGYVSVQRHKNYFFEYKKGKETYSIIYVTDGQLTYTLTNNSEVFHITKGDILFIPKHLPYKTLYLQDNTVIQIVVFDITGDAIHKHLQNPICTRSQSMAAIFSSISNDPLLLAGKAYELLYHLIRKADKKMPVKYRKILPAIDDMIAHYEENHKMEYYAGLCNMSESNFRKLFKEYTGRSVIEYRNALRIAQVNKMLDSGEFSVSEAAYAVGFHNMSFFYEVYNKERILEG
jgi:AraC-like DNA-binding protein